jgi:hypothetical protein
MCADELLTLKTNSTLLEHLPCAITELMNSGHWEIRHCHLASVKIARNW